MADPGRSAERPGRALEDSTPEEGKPLSDEAHSAFTPPLGVPLPPPPEPAAPASEFTPPAGVPAPSQPPEEPEGSAFAPPGGRAPAADHGFAAGFTPPTGIPLVRFDKESPWPDRMRALVRMPVAERPVPERAEKPEDGAGPSVPRVLDLTLRIGELLLAGGEGAEDVEAAMFGIAHAYGLARCEPNVTFTLLSMSYQPSLVDDPVTASRTVRRRGTDYTRLAAVYRLIDDITSGDDLSLEEAYGRLAEIRRNRHPYPGWALTAAGGLLAGAASVLVLGARPTIAVVFLAAAVGAMLGDRLAWLFAGRGLPEFYQFVAAATPAAAMGVALTLAHVGVPGSAVITGGLYALVPGRALVAAVQDGLTGFYITASARLLEVGYLVVGIVCGVLLVLYGGVQLGAPLKPEQAVTGAESPLVKLLAAMTLSLAFGVMLQQERRTLLAATVNGGVAWAVFGAMHLQGGISPVISTTAAAGLVGLFGQLLSRYRFSSALPYLTAAIGPLLPGSAIYYGLLGFAQGDTDAAFGSLTKAAALALAIAIGVNLGGEIARLFMRVPGAGDPAQRRAAKRTRGF
ncbi:threonine/serine exporter family protein [Streptomyces thermolineatus]|uniref:Threonine/serine exporter family protein n=1 Tax=Streptomyces thermolineatus TaxID=44033 RepID=A0ABP5ZN41_9ACTN